MNVPTLFVLAALIIALGFVGNWLFRLTRIPDSMILIAAGFILKDALGLDNDAVYAAAPYFGAFALIVILFEGGIHLEIKHLVKGWRHALKLMSLVFALSFLLITALAHFVFAHPLLNAAVLGSALACTSAAIVIPLIRQLKISQNIKTILELESSLSDAVAVLFTVMLLHIATGRAGDSDQWGMLIFSTATGSVVIGVVAGFVWSWALRKLAGQSLTYLMTFAVMLMVYAVCEGIHSSGVFGVFMFGLSLCNARTIINRLRHQDEIAYPIEELVGSGIKGFHAELTFLVRTFFFVFLGMLFDIHQITLIVLLESGAIYILILVARWAVARLTAGSLEIEGGRRHAFRVLYLFMPRGLASAVLATLPMQYGLTGTQNFINITVLIILMTNLVITLGVRSVEKTEPEEPLAAPQLQKKENDAKTTGPEQGR